MSKVIGQEILCAAPVHGAGVCRCEELNRLSGALRAPCSIVRQARDMHRRGVMWQRWGYYSKSEPLINQAKGLMCVARFRRDFLQRTVQS